MKNKKLKTGLLIFAIIIIIIFAIRTINHYRYPIVNIPESYLLPGNITDYSLNQEGMEIKIVQDGYLNALHMIPNEKTSKGLVVTFSGSSKGCDYERSVMLAKEGYEVMAMFYFGQKNQVESYNNVPLEFFSDLLKYTKDNNIDTSELTVLGISKGAELSLVLSNYYAKDIDNIVLFAPSAYVFQGGDMMAKTSSWAYKGVELPYISLFPNFINGFNMITALIFYTPYAYRAHHINVVETQENIEEYEIDFSNFTGDILIFAGEDDQLWHSDIMGTKIKEKALGNVELHIYPDAGHAFLPVSKIPYSNLGGTLEGNTASQVESNASLLEFLKIRH